MLDILCVFVILISVMRDMNKINHKREVFSKYSKGLDKAIDHLAYEHKWTKETVQRVFGAEWQSWVDEIIWRYYVEEDLLNTPIIDVMNWYEQEIAPPPDDARLLPRPHNGPRGPRKRSRK